MIDPRKAIPRLLISIGIGVVAWVAFATRLKALLAALAGWNAGVLTLLALCWHVIATFDAKATRHRAASEDFGRSASYLITLLASAVSVVAATVLVRQAKGDLPEAHILAALCLAAVVVGWTLTHTTFTLRYAHLYYRDHRNVGGVDFPGDAPPRYLDFAYLAFTVGMTFQVSDTDVSSARMRQTVLAHALLSFMYNTFILAFVLNLLVGMA
jgi:uncharacterized membrane protein